MYSEITSMLSDMSDTQLHNVLDYVTDEYDEENHEEHGLKVLLKEAKSNVLYQAMIALGDDEEATEDRLKWARKVIKKLIVDVKSA